MRQPCASVLRYCALILFLILCFYIEIDSNIYLSNLISLMQIYNYYNNAHILCYLHTMLVLYYYYPLHLLYFSLSSINSFQTTLLPLLHSSLSLFYFSLHTLLFICTCVVLLCLFFVFPFFLNEKTHF